VVGAVLVEVKITYTHVLQLPEVFDDPLDLSRRERELVLPDIAIFDVTVFLYFAIIRCYRKIPRVPTKNPSDSIEQRAITLGVCCIVSSVVRESLTIDSARRIDA
jgi:hypothetical protein